MGARLAPRLFTSRRSSCELLGRFWRLAKSAEPWAPQLPTLETPESDLIEAICFLRCPIDTGDVTAGRDVDAFIERSWARTKGDIEPPVTCAGEEARRPGNEGLARSPCDDDDDDEAPFPPPLPFTVHAATYESRAPVRLYLAERWGNYRGSNEHAARSMHLTPAPTRCARTP